MVGSSGEAVFVSAMLVILFFALYKGWYTPEVVVSCFRYYCIVVVLSPLLLFLFKVSDDTTAVQQHKQQQEGTPEATTIQQQ